MAAPAPGAIGEEGPTTPLPASLWVLLAANVVPLAGVLALDWDLGTILLLYWAESAVLLGFSLLKVALTSGLAALFLIPFFVLHAGMFMMGHLVFLLVLFVETPAGGWMGLLRDVGWVLLAFVVSHGASFLLNFRRRGEAYGKPQDVMGAFYARIVVMHLTILFGGWIILALGEPAGAVVLLVALKTGTDAYAHLRERRKHAPVAEADGRAPPTPS